MDTAKLVYAIISITVGVIVISGVLLPTLTDVTAEGEPGEQYATILGLIGILSIIAIVMVAVRLMGNSKN